MSNTELQLEAKAAEGSDAEGLRVGDFVSYQGKLFGTVEAFMPERERWVLRLSDGRQCAAQAEQLERVPFSPFSRVEVVGDDCGPLAGLCGEVTGYLPDRQRWTVMLDVGHSAAARTNQLRCAHFFFALFLRKPDCNTFCAGRRTSRSRRAPRRAAAAPAPAATTPTPASTRTTASTPATRRNSPG